MIPLKDKKPSATFPVVIISLIAANLLVECFPLRPLPGLETAGLRGGLMWEVFFGECEEVVRQ